MTSRPTVLEARSALHRCLYGGKRDIAQAQQPAKLFKRSVEHVGPDSVCCSFLGCINHKAILVVVKKQLVLENRDWLENASVQVWEGEASACQTLEYGPYSLAYPGLVQDAPCIAPLEVV